MLHGQTGARGEQCRRHPSYPDENPFSIQLWELILLQVYLLHQFSIIYTDIEIGAQLLKNSLGGT